MHAQRSSPAAKIRLPITPAILRKIQEEWSMEVTRNQQCVPCVLARTFEKLVGMKS